MKEKTLIGIYIISIFIFLFSLGYCIFTVTGKIENKGLKSVVEEIWEGKGE